MTRSLPDIVRIFTAWVAMIVLGAILLAVTGAGGKFFNHLYLLGLFEEFPVFRRLFYVAAADAVILAALPFICRKAVRIVPRNAWMFISLAAGAGVGALSALVLHPIRPVQHWAAWILPGAFYIGSNVSIFCFLHDPAFGEKTSGRLFPAPLVTFFDLIFPLAGPFIGESVKRSGKIPFVLSAYFLFLFAVVFPWLIKAEYRGYEVGVKPDKALRFIAADGGYQISLDEKDGNIIAGYDLNFIRKIDVATGKTAAEFYPEPVNHNVRAVGMDAQKDEVIYSDPWAGYTFILDRVDLRLKEKIRIRNYEEQDESFKKLGGFFCRTLFDAESGILVAFTLAEGIVLLDRTGSEILMAGAGEECRPCGFTTDAVIDPQRRLVHWINWKPSLVATNVETRRIERVEPLPSLPERIVLDKKHSRLFVTFPARGQVLVFDAATYRRVGEISTFPGVRAVGLDEENGLLFLGGFPAIFEVRSLEDYSLLDRLDSVSWTRWFAPDPVRKKVFLMSFGDGLFEYDLARLDPHSTESFFRRNDLFCSAVTLAMRAFRMVLPASIPNRSISE